VIKILVFSVDLKMLKLAAHLMFTGGEFLTVGAATVKARDAIVVVVDGC